MTWKELRKQFQSKSIELVQHENVGAEALNFLKIGKSCFPLLADKVGFETLKSYFQKFSEEIDHDSEASVSQFFYFPIWFQQNVKDPYLQKLVEWEWIQTSLEKIDWDFSELKKAELKKSTELFLNSSVQFFKMPNMAAQDFPVGLWCYCVEPNASKSIRELKLDETMAFLFEEIQESPGVTVEELEEAYEDFFETKMDRKKITHLVEDGWVRVQN